MPAAFFDEIRSAAGKKKDPSSQAGAIVKKYGLPRKAGIPLSKTVLVVKDLLEIEQLNRLNLASVRKLKRKALLLPHCSRKHMDFHCKARFDASMSSYFCQACSSDCPVNQAVKASRGRGYDVYILPGGSCLKKILTKKKYRGVLGVACCEEMKLAEGLLKGSGITLAGLSLLKNGCVKTRFNVDELGKML